MSSSARTGGIVSFTPEYRSELIARARARDRADDPNGGSFVKTARILAIQIPVPFVAQTEHGAMEGKAGDWLATNHPDDDRSSDIWPISAARFAASYERSAVITGLGAELEKSMDRLATATLGEVAGEPVPLQEYSPDGSPSSPADASPRAARNAMDDRLVRELTAYLLAIKLHDDHDHPLRYERARAHAEAFASGFANPRPDVPQETHDLGGEG